MSTLYIKYPAGLASASSFPLLAPNGSVSAPSYSFTNFPNYGVYVSANQLNFAANGILAGSADSTGTWTLGPSSGTNNHLVNGNLQISRGSGDTTLTVSNLTANANAILDFQVPNGNSSGSTYALYRRLSASGANWVQGLLVSDSDSYVIGQGTSLAAATRFIRIANSATAGVQVKGVSSNTAATAGDVGEYIESVISTLTSVPAATGVWGNMTSISLTAGDWTLDGICDIFGNGATGNTILDMAISVNSGATTTDQILGSNQTEGASFSAARDASSYIPGYRLLLSATTTVYLKLKLDYATATPQYRCRISARRMR